MTTTHQLLQPGPPIHVGRLTIDRERFLATVDGTPVDLTYREFSVLVLIVEQGGRVATYDSLAIALWDDASATTRRRLAVLISRVRSKLGAAACYVDTVQRVGYRLTPLRNEEPVTS